MKTTKYLIEGLMTIAVGIGMFLLDFAIFSLMLEDPKTIFVVILIVDFIIALAASGLIVKLGNWVCKKSDEDDEIES